MARAISWKPFSFHFRHRYEQGYRYLDRCGEFMVRAESELGFVAGDAKPTGAKMDHPDHGTHVELDVNGITVRQETPLDEGQAFLEAALGVASLAGELVRPSGITFAGFALKLFTSFATEGEVFAATLGFGGAFQESLADSLSMSPHLREFTYGFTSGSYELQVSLKPVSFNSVKRGIRRSYGFRASEAERRNVDRWNALEDARKAPDGYALFLEADLQEQNPPEGALPRQFEALQNYVEVLKHRFTLKP